MSQKQSFSEFGIDKEVLDTFIANAQVQDRSFQAEWAVLANTDFEYVYEVGIQINDTGVFEWFDVKETADNIDVKHKWTYSMNTGFTRGHSPRAVRHRLHACKKVKRAYNKLFDGELV
jgi:hypothetical protein